MIDTSYTTAGNDFPDGSYKWKDTIRAVISEDGVPFDAIKYPTR
jgi:hypothetical protein